jgi:lambda repressor-like predicted transcriptional regulator
MARAPRKPAPAKRGVEDLPEAERERILAQLRAELRKLGTHGFNARLHAVLWIEEGRPYPDVARIVGILLNRAISRGTIAGWVRTAKRKGVEALHDQRSRAALAAYGASAEIRKLHARGVSMAAIARRLQIGEIWVRRYLAMRTGQPLP